MVTKKQSVNYCSIHVEDVNSETLGDKILYLPLAKTVLKLVLSIFLVIHLGKILETLWKLLWLGGTWISNTYLWICICDTNLIHFILEFINQIKWERESSTDNEFKNVKKPWLRTHLPQVVSVLYPFLKNYRN